MPDNLKYAGDVEPKQAWDMLSDDPTATLIDVRTQAEWCYVGVVDTQTISRPALFIQWLTFPEMKVNQEFTRMVSESDVKEDDVLLFLCRSGARSKAAAVAMSELGFGKCYNIVGGFEGDMNLDSHRGKANGWKADGLPWSQT